MNKTWNEVSKIKCLWKKFAPDRDIRIKKFHLMMEFLNKRETKDLDLTKGIFTEEISPEGFVDAIKTINSLKHLKLPICGEDILEQLFLSKVKLLSLSIRWRGVKRTLDLKNIAELEELQELWVEQMYYRIENPIKNVSYVEKLHHLNSLHLIGFGEERGCVIGELKYLKHFTLQTINDFDLWETNILSLLNLESFGIEFGLLFKQWSRFFEVVSKMKKLRQLEILGGNYHISSLEKLKSCTNLEELLINQTMKNSNSNSLILRTMTEFPDHLKLFVWGVHPEFGYKEKALCVEQYYSDFEIDFNREQYIYLKTIAIIFQYKMPNLKFKLIDLETTLWPSRLFNK